MKRQVLQRALSAAALGVCAGCIWLPVHVVSDGIRAESLATITPGQVTREDVLCELGAPHRVSTDGRRIVYWTSVAESYLWTLFLLDGFGWAWGHDDYLLFEFDENGTLQKQRQVSRKYSWEPAGYLRDAEWETWLTDPAPAP